MLKAIQEAKVDAVVGYTQRFRRRWLAAKEKCRTGALGDVTLVTSRAFMNRLVAIDNYKRTDDPSTISPMVISGTHALDICMWCLEGKKPVEVYARSIDKVLGPLYQGIDATAGMIMFDDGTVYHLNISWALPVTWPAAVYSLEVGIVGTTGVLTIDDTHRDIVLAVAKAAVGRLQPRHHAAGRFHGQLSARRHGARRIARADGVGDRLVAQPHRAGPADRGGDGGRSAPQPDADQGARSVGQAQAAGEAAARCGRFQGGGVNRQREDEMKAANGWSHLRGALLILLALLAATRLCAAEDAASYPTQPIHIIVPFAPGGASDFAIRLIQPGLEKALGQRW